MTTDKKKLGVKKVDNGAAGVGKVKEIRMGQRWGSQPDDGSACVTVQFGEDPKPHKPKNGVYIDTPSPKTSELYIPASVAKQLSIGQKVKVSLTPV